MIEEYDFYGFDPFDYYPPPKEGRKIKAGEELEEDHGGSSERLRRELKEFGEELARCPTISRSSEKK